MLTNLDEYNNPLLYDDENEQFRSLTQFIACLFLIFQRRMHTSP